MRPRFSILGAGNGGLALAGDLVLRGFDVVSVYDRFPEMIEPLRAKGGITLSGKILEGFAPIRVATTDMEEAISKADVLWVVVPAYAHEFIAGSLAPYLKEGQWIVLCPGYLGGSLFFRRILKEKGCRVKVQIAETMILPYAARLVGPGRVGVRAVKRWVELSAFPGTATASVVERLRESLSQLTPGPNILATGLNNPNPMLHVATALLNTGRFESEEASRGFDFHEWISPSIARINEAMDRERLTLARALGFEGLSLAEFERRSYTRAQQVVPPEGPLPPGAGSAPQRFVTEDVPIGLVPLSDLARLASVSTPTINLMIHLACLVRGENYWKTGRTLQSMGLGGLNVAGVLRYVETGSTV